MTFQSDIASDVQQAAIGQMIFLYEIDLSDINSGTILYFTEGTTEDSQAIEFNSRTYFPIQMETEGFDVTGEGQLPRPRIRVSNAVLTLSSYVKDYNDLLGAKFTRRRTLRKYLDDGPEANPSAEFPSEIFTIQQKTEHNKFMIEFELAAYMDFEGVVIPKRQILRDFCTYQYRTFNETTNSFNYATVDIQCPYGNFGISNINPGNYLYTSLGRHTYEKSEDRCGKQWTDCELRYAGQVAWRAKQAGATVFIQVATPTTMIEEDYWLKKPSNDSSSALWYVYRNSEWIQATPDPMPTRAFPGVARFRGA